MPSPQQKKKILEIHKKMEKWKSQTYSIAMFDEPPEKQEKYISQLCVLTFLFNTICVSLIANFFFFGHGIDESVKASQMSATEEQCKK